MLTIAQARDLKVGDEVFVRRVQLGSVKYHRCTVRSVYVYAKREAVKFRTYLGDHQVQGKGNSQVFLERPVTDDAINEHSPIASGFNPTLGKHK